MAKAALDKGSMFAQIQKNGAKVPGPEQYNKNLLEKSFTAKTHGGNFSKLDRGYGKNNFKVPPVGQYETMNNPLVSPRIKGGVMSKRDRGCYLVDKAVRESRCRQAPGKYEDKELKRHIRGPNFTETKTESKVPKKPSALGPGHYDVKLEPTETAAPAYTSSREGAKSASFRSFTETQLKYKGTIPPPGHVGIPDSLKMDRAGLRMHANNIIIDRSNPPTPRE